MADLVADDRADRAVVDRRVRVRIEEGRLQDAGGEDDLVLEPAVVGVHRLRGHRPTSCDPPACRDPPADSPIRTASLRCTLPYRSAASIVRLRVVAPLVGIADHHVHLRQLLERGLLGRGAHPVVAADAVAHRRLQVGDQLLHHRLGRSPGNIRRRRSGRAARRAMLSIIVDAALPPRPQLGHADQRLGEVEPAVDERFDR